MILVDPPWMVKERAMKWLLLFIVLLTASVAHAVTVPDRTILTPGWWNNPMYYGAKGDSTADARAAIRTAYSKINAISGGVIFLPPGIFRLSDSLIFWLDTIPNLTIQGSGYNTRIILEGAGGFHIKAATAGTGTGRLIIKDMSFWSATNTGHKYALQLENIGTFTIENIQIQGRDSLDKGIYFKGTQQGVLSGGYINKCDTAVFLDSSQSINANSIAIRSVNMTGTTGAPKGIGLLTRRVQTGVLDGYGQITNFAYGVYQIGAEGYNILNTMFETCSTGVYVANGEHTDLIGNSFYTTTKNDLYLAGGSRTQVLSNLFNGKVTVGAAAVQPRFVGNLFSNIYVDSVTSASARPEYSWNHNQGAGTGPTGFKIVTHAGDSLDFRVRSLGVIDARFNADSAVFIRLSGAGTSSDTVWKSTSATYRKGRMGIEFGDSANVAAGKTPPLYAIFGSTNASNGLYVATYAGATPDSLLPRLQFMGNAASTTILTQNASFRKGANNADSAYATLQFVRDSAGGGSDNDTAKVLANAGGAPIVDKAEWVNGSGTSDTLLLDSDEPSVTVRSPDSLYVEANSVGIPGGSLLEITPDTTRNDAGTGFFGTNAFPWKIIFQRDWEWDAGSEEAQYDTTDTPANGEQLTWSTGGAVGWSASGSGASDSIGIDTNGGAIDYYVYPSYLREGTGAVFTTTGDTLTIGSTGGSIDTVAKYQDPNGGTLGVPYSQMYDGSRDSLWFWPNSGSFKIGTDSVLELAGDAKTILGDTTSIASRLRVRATVETYLDTSGGYYYTPWDSAETTVPAVGDVLRR